MKINIKEEEELPRMHKMYLISEEQEKIMKEYIKKIKIKDSYRYQRKTVKHIL